MRKSRDPWPLWWLRVNPYGHLIFSKMERKEPTFITIFLPEYISDLLSPFLERLCLCLKADTSLIIGTIGMVKDISNFFQRSRINFQCNLNLLLWFTLMVDPSWTHLHWQRKLIREIPLRKSLVQILAQSQTQFHTLSLLPCRNLLLSPIFYQGNPLSYLRKITCLRVERIRLLQKRPLFKESL